MTSLSSFIQNGWEVTCFVLIKQEENRLYNSIDNLAFSFDVGSNKGSYALVASEVATASVFAFEPGSSAFSGLKRNIELNHRANVKPLNIAVSDQESVLMLRVDKK